MNNRYSFRGKRIDNSEWVYGYFVKDENENCLIVSGLYFTDGTFEDDKVYPDTVGQYTGLKDSNGTDIYEGDVVVVGNEKYDVLFDEGIFYLHHLYGEKNECVYIYESLRGKITGNIHDK